MSCLIESLGPVALAHLRANIVVQMDQREPYAKIISDKAQTTQDDYKDLYRFWRNEDKFLALKLQIQLKDSKTLEFCVDHNFWGRSFLEVRPSNYCWKVETSNEFFCGRNVCKIATKSKEFSLEIYSPEN